jgi:hypothetical protein
VAYCSAGCQGAHRHGAEACHSHKRLLELITERDEVSASQVHQPIQPHR